MAEEIKPLEILVIDDDPIVLIVVSKMMQSLNCSVTTATGGQEGIDTYLSALEKGKNYDGVITDLSMPHVNGVAVLRAIRDSSHPVPVYYVSGYLADDEYRRSSDEAHKLKPEGFLEKPFSLAKLNSIIEDIRKRKETTQSSQS